MLKDPSKISYSSKCRTSISHRDKQYATLMADYLDKAISDPHALAECIPFFPRRFNQIPRSESRLQISGCCMLIQISGLCDLISDFCFGKDFESVIRNRLSRVNTVIETIIQCVYSYCGDVISLHTGSLLCLFHHSTEHDTISDCSLKAAKCGLQLTQTQFEGVELRVAITCGNMNFSVLGGYNGKCSFLLSGDCVDTIDHYLTTAKPQELIISDNLYLVIANDFAVATAASGARVTGIRQRSLLTMKCRLPSWDIESVSSSCINDSLLESNDIDEFAHSYGEIGDRDLVSCIPLPVVEAVVSKTVPETYSLHKVTALLMRLDNYSSEEHDDISDLQPYIFSMQKCLDECGGMLQRFIIDDKGCVLIGLWGVPTANHTSNCSRALRCAVMMRNEAKKLLHDVSIGITTGYAYCGILGTDYRRDYVVFGKSIELAVGLMVHAEGRVLIDDETIDRLGLDIASNTCLTEPVVLPGQSSDAVYHSYVSPVPFSAHTRDVRPDKDIILEKYIRRALCSVLEVKDGTSCIISEISSTSSCSTASDGDFSITKLSPSSRRQILSDTSRSNVTPAGNVLIITGTSGSGKTSIANCFVRRFVSRDTFTRDKSPRNTCANAVFIPLTDADDVSCGSLRKIFFSLFDWFGMYSENCQKNFMVRMIGGAFPSYSATAAVLQLFPVITKVLNVNWDWGISISAEDLKIYNGYSNYRVDRTDTDIIADLLLYILSDNVPVLCIDDAHFMCSFSWGVITRLCILGPGPVVILTIRVNSAPISNSTSDVIKFRPSQGKQVGENQLIELPRYNSFTSSTAVMDNSESIIPVRHATEFSTLLQSLPCRQVHKIHLRNLSTRSVKKILRRHFTSNFSESDVTCLGQLTLANPFLLWKFIDFANTICHSDIESALLRVHNTGIISTLTNVLSETDLAVLRTAGVIGEQFYIDVLRDVLPRYLCTYLYSALTSLEANGLIVPLADGFFSFSNGLIRMYIYEQVPQSDAVALHGKIAAAMEKMYSYNCISHCESICYHYTMSNQKKMTAKWACAAANSYLLRGDIISAMPYMDVAMLSGLGRSSTLKLLGLLSKSIGITRERMKNSNNEIIPSPVLNDLLCRQESMCVRLRRRQNFFLGLVNTVNHILSGARFSNHRKIYVDCS